MVFAVFLFGCERTEKPEGWDEKNKKPEVEKDTTEDLESKYEKKYFIIYGFCCIFIWL